MRTKMMITGTFLMMAAICMASPVHADSYSNAIGLFKKSPQVQPFFNNAYGYAVFPTVGKGGIGIGGAYGKGKVYRGGKATGTVSLAKVSIGLQLGGQAFSEIIFFQDQRAFNEFTSGAFAFGAASSGCVEQTVPYPG